MNDTIKKVIVGAVLVAGGATGGVLIDKQPPAPKPIAKEFNSILGTKRVVTEDGLPVEEMCYKIKNNQTPKTQAQLQSLQKVEVTTLPDKAQSVLDSIKNLKNKEKL